MKSSPAIYLGRIVPRETFRTFIYDTNLNKKLVESWDDYESYISTGIWFTTIDDANSSKIRKKRTYTKRDAVAVIDVKNE